MEKQRPKDYTTKLLYCGRHGLDYVFGSIRTELRKLEVYCNTYWNSEQTWLNFEGHTYILYITLEEAQNEKLNFNYKKVDGPTKVFVNQVLFDQIKRDGEGGSYALGWRFG